MWSQIVLAFLVAFAYASENPAWNQHQNYVYKIEARSIVGLNQISDEYSGILINADLIVQPRSDGNLAAKITNAQYAQVHKQLEEGWETEIPQSELQYKKLKLSEKPFQIVLEKGVVRNVIVSKQINNWEANMIKSIVSQFQLDTKAKNLIPSSINILTQENSNTAVYKTMEETVTGVAETLYEIHPYPEYVLQSRPWVVPHKQLIEQGEVIEIVKSKNFTHSPHNPSFHFGFEGIEEYQPGNKMGDFFTRASTSQVVITGNLDRYTIQSAVTIDQITLSPTLGENQRGSVFTKLNVTLSHIQQQREAQLEEVDSPVEVGLVYAYNKPYATDNSPRPANEYDHGVAPSSAEYLDTPRNQLPRLSRSPRALEMEEEEWHQEKPRLNEASPAPLLPLAVGYDGQSFKKTQNIIETVRRLAQEIGQEFPHPKETLQQQTAVKYVTLVRLVRIMDQNEIQKVAEQLYENSNQSPAWIAFRDAVAQSGTGPAIYNMKQWIQNNKVSNVEAAHIIATAADAAREPTEQYIKFFFEMVQDENIMAKQHLNKSVLLSFTTLARQVYGNRQESQGKYPVYSYGTFRSSRGQEYVKKTVIPYLTEKLNEAISRNDNQKVHAYIRALGNVGQQEILEAFEPYLEGQKQASHFQRVLMIVALDKLAESNKQVARSVLYKVYQNPTEHEQVRVAAVFQLMRTRPSASMLQRMATYTNIDGSHYVNAAVKSSIQTAAQLQAPEHDSLRTAAQSAESLLTSQEYGAQYSQGYLRDYTQEQAQLAYQQYFQTFAGKDHAVPKGFKYMLQKQLGGVKFNTVNVEAIVSSMEDLINVFQQQTKEYQNQQQEKQSQNSHPWSSENLAKVLNLQNEQREQLEGSLYYKIGALQSILSFDNHTIENLPEVIKHLENELQQGKHFEYSKMVYGHEATYAVPTALGLPFIFQYETPILMKLKSEIRANSEPQISTGQLFQKPDAVKAEFEVNAFVTGREQSEFGIFTPFDHQRYCAGYNKNFQVVVPLTGKIHLNVRKQQLQIDVENPGSQENIRLAHYSSWPYTAQHDIYNPKPEQKIIRSENLYRRNIVVGDKATGIGAYLQISSDERIDLAHLYEQYQQHEDVIAFMLQPWVDEDMKYVHIDAGIDASKTTTQQIVLRLGYQTEYQENDPNSQKPNFNKKVSDIPAFSDDAEKRQKEFVEQLGRHINNARVVVGDVTLELLGQNKIKYSVTAGVAKSDVDTNSRLMAYVRKLEKQQPQTLVYVQAVGKVPNTNGLNLDYAMQIDPTCKYEVQGLLKHQDRLSRVDAKIQLSKSQQRVQYLQQQDEYRQCKEQMRQGNQQLPICARVTAEANLLDQFAVEMKLEKMSPRLINCTYQVYSILRHQLYPRVQENIVESQLENEVQIQGQFSHDLEHINASMTTPYGKTEIKNVQLNDWARALLVPHPVFHTPARLQAEILELDTYRPICTVDKNQASSFDNKTFEAKLKNQWTVVLQYVPRRPSPVPNKPDQTVPEQLHQTVESYALYARAAQEESSQKEIQIVLQMPSTQGKVVKMDLKPARQGKGPRVLVNDQEVKYNEQSSSDFYNGHIQIYALPNQEVKVEVRNAFYIIFDGQTLKLTAVNSKFRDSTRGLCGTFTGEPETDFVGPEDCIFREPEQFIQSYTVGSQSHPVKMNVETKKCYQKRVISANYISNQDAGRSSSYDHRTGDDCTGHLSRYEERNGEICFSVRPLPFCKSGCKPLQQATKSIDVHCLEPTANTGFWRSQIDKKINVDFSMMQPTGKLDMLIPSRCVA